MKKSIRQKIEDRRMRMRWPNQGKHYGSFFQAVDDQDPDAIANWFSLLEGEGEYVEMNEDGYVEYG